MALGFMRRHKGWLKYWLLLVVLAFIILYIPDFQDASTGGPGEVLATVGEERITMGEFQRVWLQQRQQLASRGLDAAMIEQLGLREQVLQGLVDRKLVALEARRLGLKVEDEAVAREIRRLFQSRGRFVGAEEVRRQLALQGSSEEELTESLREALLAQRLQALVTDSVHVSEAEAEREFRRRNERVKLEYVQVLAAHHRPEVTAEPAEVEARFQAARESYRIPERRVAAYLLVEPAALQSQVSVTDGELEAYYRENETRFQTPEEVCARHILIKAPAAGPAEEAARRRAEALLAQIKAGGDFAALARGASEDAGSASQGGDLGCFGRGRMVPEFEAAAFALEPGALSELVRTTHGVHIIQLLSRKEEQTRPLAEVKEPIRRMLLERKARELAETRAAEVSAALARGKSLEEAGRASGLTVHKSTPMARGDVVPPLNGPEVQARIFSLGRGESHAEPFASPRGWVFVSVQEVQPSRLPELAEVRDRIREDLLEAKARARARDKAEQLRGRAEREGLDKAAAALGLLRKETPAPVGRGEPMGELGSTLALEQAVFALPAQTLSSPLPTAGGFAVVRVAEKTAFDPAAFAEQKASLREELEQQEKERLFSAYLQRVRERFPVERRLAAMRRLSG